MEQNSSYMTQKCGLYTYLENLFFILYKELKNDNNTSLPPTHPLAGIFFFNYPDYKNLKVVNNSHPLLHIS